MLVALIRNYYLWESCTADNEAGRRITSISRIGPASWHSQPLINIKGSNATLKVTGQETIGIRHHIKDKILGLLSKYSEGCRMISPHFQTLENYGESCALVKP